MPKCEFIDPKFIRSKGKIEFTDIPVNVYNKTIADEKKNFSNDDFVRIFNDIAVLREIERLEADYRTKETELA